MFGWKEQRIKVHCVASCLCEVVKRYSEIDYRPFYFGVWDEPFAVNENGLSYFSPDFKHERMLRWHEHLFGSRVSRWHDAHLGAERNAQRLIELVADTNDHFHVVVQIDMSLLPERENKFQLSPFPHYVLVSATEKNEEWYLLDADMKWEGRVDRDWVVQAFVGNPYPDGFVIETQHLRSPDEADVSSFFYDSCPASSSPLASSLRAMITSYASDSVKLPQLADALKHLHVIVIRKYSYDYALMFLHDELGLGREHYEHWAQQIRDAVQAYNTVQYIAVKMALTGRTNQLPSVMEALDRADDLEQRLKKELEREVSLWSAMRRAAHV
ncbi:DUF6005 family protein [Paenibacillus sp. GD4]|uniref:DUF6005 family protein n=1 Tax=Paenibacillus sp. GD4 TaxID=3068890 RepID=UPI002796D895|nr:DUF6005 family protein [Paenibacillus sp. GD4]MDQ1914163.1 DUF6005 family protein [Paenibacillus sp. GD4]